MSERRIVLTGFEEALAGAIEAASANTVPPAETEFRFSTPGLKDLALVAGRHLFVSDLPEEEEIAATIESGQPEYEADKEPAIAIYCETDPGVVPSVSSGARMTWRLRIVLRVGVVFEHAKQLLEELVEFLASDAFRGRRMGPFVLKLAVIEARPAVFARAGDGHAYVSAVLRCTAVARPT